MNQKKKVDDLIGEKKKIEKEISKLQSECSHTLKSLKQVPIQSSFEVRWVCDECSNVLGWPSPPELEKFFKTK